MRLNRAELKHTNQWKQADIRLPRFDLQAAASHTAAAPTWVHFGAGNIFRAFIAAAGQELLEKELVDTGIIVAEGYDYEIIEKIYVPRDHLGLLATLKADGSIEKRVIASVTEALCVNRANKADFNRLTQIFTSPSLQMVSFTITEKGYSLVGSNGDLLPDVAADFAGGPVNTTSYLGKLASLCYARYQAGALPVALVSMDNCSHNGDKLKAAVTAFAQNWEDAALIAPGFLAYLNDSAKVAFPWSMIDKITPRPDEAVREMLRQSGFDDVQDVVTSKNTFIAPFVNAEETQYLVIEDAFPAGRPPLEQAGIIFTDRGTVDKVEKMKVCTCLNPLHTALAVFGCLLGYTKISDEMQDPDLVALIEQIGYAEGLPVVVNPGILNPRDFIDNVLQVRLPNPFMPDTPQRIATDTSQKLSIRFGETIKAYLENPALDVSALSCIPLVLAGWCRYLLGIDDNGQPFAVSSDPLYDTVSTHLAGITLGSSGPFHSALNPILSDASIFGVNLYQAGMGERIEELFAQLVAGTGAVRNTLAQTLDK